MIVYLVILSDYESVEILAVCATKERADAEALREAAKRWDVTNAKWCDPLESHMGVIDIEEYEVLP